MSSKGSKILATFALPSSFLPEPSALRTCVVEPSSLPTPTAASYGSSNNGTRDGETAYATKGKPSLWTMAEAGTLPAHPTGKLRPEWTEWAMGFPEGWTWIDTGQTGFEF